jgi:DNA-binding NarL/FixJ family response regulator
MKTQLVRVLLADDHDVVRRGVRTMLECREGWQVCGEATTGKEAVKLASELRPDIAVLDLEMGELDGLEATRLIKKAEPQIEVLIFTMHDTEYLIREVLSAGARAFVLKSEGGRKLIEAIENASKHKPFFAAKASEALLNQLLKSRATANESSHLTEREREVVRLLAMGKTNKEAAVTLGISVKTVETHRAAIMRKLGFNSIVELVRYAVRERLVKILGTGNEF